MHELWICKNILEIIKQHSSKLKDHHIKKVYLEVGRLAAIDHISLMMSFNVITKGTIAEQAVLEIIEVPAKAICDSCQKTVSISQYYDPCQYCGSNILTIIQGDELRLKSMEVM